MTPDERIEKLLNQCGQTISDLPKDYDIARKVAAVNYILSLGRTEIGYILHLTDIIDRMEIALNNTLVKLEEHHDNVGVFGSEEAARKALTKKEKSNGES